MSNIVNPSTYVKCATMELEDMSVNCKVNFRFSKSHGGSNGLRDYIEHDLMDFVKANPGVVVYLKPRRIGPPSMTAEYLNGHNHYRSLPKHKREDIVKWVEFARTQSGYPISRFIKNQHSDTPSVQGVWTPFTNKPTSLNITNFPEEELSKAKPFFPSATEQLIEIAKHFEHRTESNRKRTICPEKSLV